MKCSRGDVLKAERSRVDDLEDSKAQDEIIQSSILAVLLN